jgi:WD40 repeat protein
VISISADGSAKQWSGSGQPHPPNVPFPKAHALGLTSLSVTPDGHYALYNSIEGSTFLWDLDRGEIVSQYDSYAQTGDGAEPCTQFLLSFHLSNNTNIVIQHGLSLSTPPEKHMLLPETLGTSRFAPLRSPILVNPSPFYHLGETSLDFIVSM